MLRKLEIENVVDESCFFNLIFKEENLFIEKLNKYLALKIESELRKYPVFDGFDLKRLTRY